MTAEHQPSPEKQPRPEHPEAAPRRERAEVHRQTAAEKAEVVERARHRVETNAAEIKPHPTAETHPQATPTKSDKKRLYRHTLKQIQTDLPSRSSRTFSKFIHQPVVEKTSEAAAKTVFRPSITLGASLGALVGGTLTYLVARRYGFELPRSHFLVYALLGAVIGLSLEGLRAALRRLFKRS